MIDPHFQKLFALGLGIDAPWIIKSIEMKPSEKNPSLMELHILVDFTEGSTFNYPGMDAKYPVYDTRERTWRHLNFFQYRCYITARVPRIKTPDGKIKTVPVPWGRVGSGFTLLMESVILALVKHMPVKTVAREIGEQDSRIWRLIEYHVSEALNGQDFSDVTAIGADEYSHKGHNYITVFLSHPDVIIEDFGKRRQSGKGRVLFVAEGKDKGTVLAFLERFKQKKGIPENVKVTTSDMIHGCRTAFKENFPNSVTTVDKFHVIKKFSDSVDNIRRREMSSRNPKKYKALGGSRYLWLKNPENLTESQKDKLGQLLNVEYLETVQAYNFRLEIQDFYERNRSYCEEMISDFENIALRLVNSTIHEMKKLGESLTKNAEEILNYFLTFRTNAILEGFNSKISIIKNRARGFRNLKNFMNMIYFVCGELSLPTQSIF